MTATTHNVTPFGLLVGTLLGSGAVSTLYIWWADR